MTDLSNEELHKRLYPRRPDPKKAPEVFKTWKRRVSTPATIIEPQEVINPDIRHDIAVSAAPGTRPNWSGVELPHSNITAPDSTGFCSTYGYWKVPSVTGESSTPPYSIQTHSAMWVGIDGDQTYTGTPANQTPLVQAGTEQNCLTTDDGLGHRSSASTYYLWHEFLPQEGSEIQVTNLSIVPGDTIYVKIDAANDGTGIGLPGDQVDFIFEKDVQPFSSALIISTRRDKTVQGSAVLGTTAEWIMERPLVNGAFGELANYGSTWLACGDAWATPHGGVPVTNANSTQLTMQNSAGTTLSSCTQTDWGPDAADPEALFTWVNFH